MRTFLEQVADALVAEHGVRMADVGIVLPSRRAGLYLRSAIAARANGPVWIPELHTWTTFMERLSGLRAASMEEQLFAAYDALEELDGKGAHDLEELLQWCPTLLADMSEVDSALLGLDGFYRDLRSWEELDWSFREDPLSEGQQRMVRYWERAGRAHRAINARLATTGSGTAGAVERAAAMGLSAPGPWRMVWFVGLNAFTAAQRQVMDTLHAASVARFAWDADLAYLDDPVQEAGRHLRAAITRYGAGVVAPTTGLRDAACTVEVLETSGPAAQAWAVAGRVAALHQEERSRTAVVLADPSVLPLLLEALPADVSPLNVTMGIALAELPVGSLLQAAVRTFAAAEAGGAFLPGGGLLDQPLLRNAPGGPALIRRTGDGQQPLKALREEDLIGVDPEVTDAIRCVLSPAPDTAVPERMKALLRWVIAGGANAFLGEQVYQAARMIDRVGGLFTRHGRTGDARDWNALLPRLLRMVRVGFEGEPMHGLQVMGMLEARALDHEQVLVIGAQEGVLPSTAVDRSFIPFELRRAHGLPLGDETDAVQAYTFFRLMNRARKLTVTCSIADSAPAPSRFIQQLRLERFAEAPDAFRTVHINVPVPDRTGEGYAFTLDAAGRALLLARLARGLSPSMLRAWLVCPLDMWLRHVLRVPEGAPTGDRVPPNVVGEAVHGVLQALYTPWLGRSLDPSELRSAAREVRGLLAASMAAHVPAHRLERGEPLLQLGMATAALEHFLLAEAGLVEGGTDIRPMHLELEVRRPLGPLADHADAVVNIVGRLDRVDLRNGRWHVLDLKTGHADPQHLRLKALEADQLRRDKGHAAQLLLYAWAFLGTHPEARAVSCGLLPLQRTGAAEPALLNIDGDPLITASMTEGIGGIIRANVERMLDPGTVYRHDERSQYCALCAG